MGEMADMREYLAAMRAALTGVSGRDRDEAVAELEANLRAEIERRGGNLAAVQAALADLGRPEEYARAVREALLGEGDSPEPQGRVLGMPYEFRAPTAGRVMERLWNPSDPRILMPRLWGVGWTVNFGAVAVPAVLAAVALTLTLAFWGRLPADVPMHFNGAGVADDWGSKPVVLGMLLAIATCLPTVVLGWQGLSRASRGTRVITSVLLTFSSMLATVILGYTIANALYGVAGWWVGLLIIGCIVLPGAMFYLLARASLSQEWRATTESRGSDPREGVR